MENFWDFNVWGGFVVVAVLLISLLVAHALKKNIHFLQASLIPTSVLGGAILLIISSVYKVFSGTNLFDAPIFGGNGTALLEIITYHSLALGFVASVFKSAHNKFTRERNREIFNTGVTTVSTYLLQGIVGLAITMVTATIVTGFFPAAGVLLPFGYGQGTGQALNYGGIYEMQFGFEGGKSFGLTIAALGFLSASIGGVIHLNILKKRGFIAMKRQEEGAISSEEIQGGNEIPMQESLDKMTVQVAIVAVAYLLAYLAMFAIGKALPGMKSVVYGFNFLLGVLMATLIKGILNLLHKKGVVQKNYTNSFLMTRISNFFFDIMVVAGIAAIRLSILKKYWGIMLILGVVGLVITYFYNHFVAKKLFPGYVEEQFLAMFGMLTGTASTGVVLLREIDGDLRTPVAENLVYQNFPAMVFGFPMMLLATLAPVKPLTVLLILIGFFAVMNVILFRSFIFKKKKTPAKV